MIICALVKHELISEFISAPIL